MSGLVLSRQSGANWSIYADKTGPVLSPLMADAVLSAFFREAGFFGVMLFGMLFGMSRIGPRLHFLAILMVAIGTGKEPYVCIKRRTADGFSNSESDRCDPPCGAIDALHRPRDPGAVHHSVTAA